jgi:hypothetical protein
MEDTMNRRLFIIVALLAAVVLTGAFAEGSRERDERFYGPRGRTDRPEFAEEITELTGQVYLEADEFHPVLRSGSKEYELMAPRWQAIDADIEEGETVTVKGYLVEGAPCCDEDDEGAHLFVTTAVIDGKEYEVGRGSYAGPMMGRRGMMPGKRPGIRGGAWMGGTDSDQSDGPGARWR